MMIIEASQKANNVRVLIQSSWSDISGGLEVPSNIMFLGNCPHDWPMPRVCAVVHHGGASTTAAGLLAALQAPNIREQVMVIRHVMSKEDGANEAVHCFYRNLPLGSMRCDVDSKNIATHWSQKDHLKLCTECAFVIGSRPENSESDILAYHFVDYSAARGPDSTLEGASAGTGAYFHEIGHGFKDFFVQPVNKDDGAKGAVVGFAKGLTSYMVSPLRGLAVFADHVATGRYNEKRGEEDRKKGTVLLGNKQIRRAFGYNVTPDSHTAMNSIEAVKVHKPAIERPHVVIYITEEDKRNLEAKFYEVISERNSSGGELSSPIAPLSSAATVVSNDNYPDLFGTNGASSSESSDDETSERDSSANKELTEGQLKQQQAAFKSEEIKQKRLLAKIQKTLIPKMNICLMTVGSWDENVQQFVAIGLRLKADGQRVRIATTCEFRERIIASRLEFYPLGGKASTMGKYLHYLYTRRHEAKIFSSKKSSPRVDEDEIKSMVFSLWSACVSADPLSPCMAFRADGIIAHPLVVGQTIVAERLGVPLHCMSTTPLTRTHAFPHLMSSWLAFIWVKCRSGQDLVWLKSQI